MGNRKRQIKTTREKKTLFGQPAGNSNLFICCIFFFFFVFECSISEPVTILGFHPVRILAVI